MTWMPIKKKSVPFMTSGTLFICQADGLSVAQTEVIGTSQHLGLGHADRVEAHSCKDERHQGKACLPVHLNKTGINTQDEYKSQEYDVVASKQAAVEDGTLTGGIMYECIKNDVPYVLAGSIFVHIGDKKNKVKKGESFYFKPRANHYISNAGKNEARVVWVSTPPSF